MQDLWYARSASQGVTLPEDAVRQETNRAKNERQQAQRQRRRLQSAVRAVARAQGGGGTPSEPESSGDDDDEEDEDEEEGEITPSPPPLPPPKDLPSLGNLFSQQAEISVGAHGQNTPGQEPCHTPFREIGNEASIRVPRMFKSHAWQQYDKQMQCY
jgi:hypothetical protein